MFLKQDEEIASKPIHAMKAETYATIVIGICRFEEYLPEDWIPSKRPRTVVVSSSKTGVSANSLESSAVTAEISGTTFR
jgi:hypothetical protein